MGKCVLALSGQNNEDQVGQQELYKDPPHPAFLFETMK